MEVSQPNFSKPKTVYFKPKILIVDDKLENLFTLRKVLSELEAEVVEADNGNDALIAILNHDFSLVILDVQMPDMDGYELAELIRSEEQNRSLPIIFLSAVFSDEFHVFKGYKSGAVDFITKPFNPEILLFKVNTFLELARQRAKISAQNEELNHSLSAFNYVNKKLQAKQEELNRLNGELEKNNQTLETRVKERSIELYKVNRELRQTNKELDLFIYRASHDLRGPVATLIGLSQLAQLETQEVTSQTYFQKIQHTSEKMLGLLQKLAAINMINDEVGETIALDFEELIETVFGMLSSQAKAQNVKLTYQVSVTINCHAFSKLLKIIILNLLENSIAFRNPEAEQPYAKISIRSVESGTEIIVEDNGIGIPTKYGDKIYAMFFRGTELSKGNGLGLYLVKKAVRKLGGEIRLKSREMKFSKFYVTVPCHCQTNPKVS